MPSQRLGENSRTEPKVVFNDRWYYTGRPAHGWIRRGATVELKSNHGRTRLNLNGALAWPDRSLIHHEEKITSTAMIRLFETLAAKHPEAITVTVVLDNARYNRSRELKAWLDRPGCRLKLVYLPSYAPNLNLIERFWHFLERQVLFNKAYSTFVLFKKAFDDFFERLHEHEAALASLITDRFHLIGQPKTGISSAQGYTSRPTPRWRTRLPRRSATALVSRSPPP